jgi:hypothetical protein
MFRVCSRKDLISRFCHYGKTNPKENAKMKDDKKDVKQDLVPAEDILIFELDDRLEFGTPILEPALSLLDQTACNGSACNSRACPQQPA